MPLFGGYKANKLKPQLKMAVTRFTIASNKKSALMKQQIREIAKLLAEDPPKEEKARIKAEALIRDDDTVEAYELLQLSCELLSERLNLITHSKECPADILSTVATIIWASSVVDIPELIEVRKQFRYKFGAAFDERAMLNVDGIVNDRVASKLSFQPPSAYKVQTYLEKISDEHEVGWKPKVPLKAEDIAQPMPPPVGYSVPENAASGLNKKDYDAGDPAPSMPSTILPVPPKGTEGAYVPVLPAPAVAIPVPVPTIPKTSNKQDDVSVKKDDFVVEEPDIFVPPAPRSRPHSGNNTNNSSEVNNRGRTQSAGENPKGNDDDDDDEDKTGGDATYDDLAMRFAMLSK
mmetsp:Transcript_19575/g.29179  ORF Transcript_19575/g.29179 Transcript_19575/m.29179 type:complete len:348 (-) Transcript_19575:111-1154(-)